MGLKVGGLNAEPGDLYSKAQRIFTGRKATHSFVVLEEFYDEKVLLDARYSVTIDPESRVIDNQNLELWLFEIPIENAREVEKKVYKQFIGQDYGYKQLPWFLWRRFLEQFSDKDFRKTYRKALTSGVICSELVWWALYYCGGSVKDYIIQYNSDAIHSGDIKDILYDMYYKGLAKLVLERYINNNRSS